MSPEEQYIRPPSLRAYLESGGDLTGFALLDSLVEAVVVARRLLPAETNRKQAARNRRFVERWFARHGGEEPVPATQELLTFAFWKAECLEDPMLADVFEAALPADTLGRALQLVDDLRHVHPLAVREEIPAESDASHAAWRLSRLPRVERKSGPPRLVGVRDSCTSPGRTCTR